MKCYNLLAILLSVVSAQDTAKDVEPLVSHGAIVPEGKFPFQVGIYSQFNLICGGVIISKTQVSFVVNLKFWFNYYYYRTQEVSHVVLHSYLKLFPFCRS